MKFKELTNKYEVIYKKNLLKAENSIYKTIKFLSS